MNGLVQLLSKMRAHTRCDTETVNLITKAAAQ